MTIRLIARLDVTDAGEIVWWADSPDMAGVSVAAASLRELESLGREAVADIEPTADVVVRLLGSVPSTGADLTAAASTATGPEPAGANFDADRVPQRLVPA